MRPAGVRRLKIAGLCLVFLWFLLGGIAHFAATDTEMRIVPPYVPWPRVVVLVTGVLELAGAAGLLFRATRKYAGIGLFVLTIVMTPANIYMLQRAELFHVPYWILVARLPAQLVLLALIAWGTSAQRARSGIRVASTLSRKSRRPGR
jgi:uncharacterized membrane protein